mgnify:FL=1
MKKLVFILPLIIVLSCSKGDSYCVEPNELNGFREVPQNNDPKKVVRVELDYLQTFNKDQEGTLFAFSTPDVFVNPKGDYTEDVVSDPVYNYYLKDTANPPVSVKIYAYAFNDCGETQKEEVVITYAP